MNYRPWKCALLVHVFCNAEGSNVQFDLLIAPQGNPLPVIQVCVVTDLAKAHPRPLPLRIKYLASIIQLGIHRGKLDGLITHVPNMNIDLRIAAQRVGIGHGLKLDRRLKTVQRFSPNKGPMLFQWTVPWDFAHAEILT
jgi:hypothetical protein